MPLTIERWKDHVRSMPSVVSSSVWRCSSDHPHATEMILSSSSAEEWIVCNMSSLVCKSVFRTSFLLRQCISSWRTGISASPIGLEPLGRRAATARASLTVDSISFGMFEISVVECTPHAPSARIRRVAPISWPGMACSNWPSLRRTEDVVSAIRRISA